MKPFKILIVEDEVLIADNLKRFLTKKGYHILDIAISYEEAVEIYLREKPDIALLDIRLNGPKTGIDFAHFLQEQSNPIPFIFLTSQIDIQNINSAKDSFPAGYLSKPVQKDSLYATIEVIMHKFNVDESEMKSIPIFDGNKSYMVPIKDIMYFQAEHVYVKVYLVDGQQIIQRSSLKDLLEQLPSKQFIQTHRSFAINLKQVSHWDYQQIYVGDITIPLSRSRRKIVLNALNPN